ncbi:MAG: prolipoprotein diacylglyceryl transferase [Ruminiclostridium sp.]
MFKLLKNAIEFPNLFSGEIEINPTAISIFGYEIKWYAIIIALGLILAVVYCTIRGKKYGLTGDDIFDVALFGGIAGFLGARIYYVIFWNLNPENTYKYDIITTFTEIHNGGLAIYGGIIFGVLAGIIVCKIKKTPILPIMDMGGTGFLIGQAIGRWGNFVNQEAFGAPTAGNLPWGMTGTIISQYPEVIEAQNALPAGEYALVHPCFLYESLWCGLGILVIHFLLSRIQTFDGELFLYYVIWYGTGRGFIEGLRTDSLYIGPLRVSQLLGFASALFCLILLIYFKVKISKNTEYKRWKDTPECAERQEKYYTAIKNEEETEKALKAMKRAEKNDVKAVSIFDDIDEEEKK